MGLLTALLQGYANGVQAHTGLHYVPSFNDLNTHSNDDLEEDVIKSERTSLSGAPMHGGGMMMHDSNSVLAPSPPASPGMYTMPAYHPAASSGPRLPRSNKTDSSPGLDPYPDIHKVGRHMSARHQLMDRPRGPNEPSVWEVIAHHQDKKHT